MELGSLRKVAEEFLREGITNPKTGERPTGSAIEKSAFSWAIRNVGEARQDLEYAQKKEGVILTEEAWKKKLVNMCELVFQDRPGRFKEAIDRLGLKEYV